jgi:hypothetical protein
MVDDDSTTNRTIQTAPTVNGTEANMAGCRLSIGFSSVSMACWAWQNDFNWKNKTLEQYMQYLQKYFSSHLHSVPTIELN